MKTATRNAKAYIDYNRLAPALAGRRNPGQRSLKVLVAGPDNAAEAEAAARAELETLIM